MFGSIYPTPQIYPTQMHSNEHILYLCESPQFSVFKQPVNWKESWKKAVECYNQVYSMCGLYHIHLWSRWVADCTGVLKGLHRHTHRVCFRSLWPWESKQHCRHQCWQGAWDRTSDVDQPFVTLSLCCIMPAFFTLVILMMVKYWWILRVAFQKMDIYVHYFIFSSWNNRNFYRPFLTDNILRPK